LCNKKPGEMPPDFPLSERDKQILGSVFLFQEFKSFKNEKDLSEKIRDIRSFDYHGKERMLLKVLFNILFFRSNTGSNGKCIRLCF
jgi:hypothetical protein